MSHATLAIQEQVSFDGRDASIDRPALIRLLAGIRTKESEDVLQELAQSKDWKLRTEITTIRNELRRVDRKERNHAV